MDSTASCPKLNTLLIEIHRSLLQYAVEAAPWVSENDEAASQQLTAYAGEQEATVEILVELLRSRKHLVDFGVYPHEYTSLHFVSLDYFLDRLKESQAMLVDQLKTAVGSLAGDLEAVQLIESALEVNQKILDGLAKTELSTQA